MIHGLDTGFLIAAELREHPHHGAVRAIIAGLIAAGDQLALAPQVLLEFIHVATDSRRFAQPLTMSASQEIAEAWWTARDVVHVFPGQAAVGRFFAWRQQLSLGRKRLLDTLLAATYCESGIHSLLTTNETDFAAFGAFTCIGPGRTAGNP